MFQSSVFPGGFELPLSVEGVGGSDNVYRLVVTEFPLRGPDRFDLDNSQNFSESRPDNNLMVRAVPIGGSGGLPWLAGDGGILQTSVLDQLSLNFHIPADEDWFVFRQLPSGPGRGGPPNCVSALEIEWNASVRYESIVEDQSQVLSRVGGQPIIRILNPQNGLKLRLTPASSAPSTDYVLNATFYPVPRNPICP